MARDRRSIPGARGRGAAAAITREDGRHRVRATLRDGGRTPEALARAREASIASVIRPLGLVRRAATLREMAKVVVRRGGVPSTVGELLELPGVGPYAAGATAAVAFGAHEAVVDGVSARVYRRYFGLDGAGLPRTTASSGRSVRAATPRRAVKEWNWAVLDLAALVCLPATPRCPSCPLKASCKAATSEIAVSDPTARVVMTRCDLPPVGPPPRRGVDWLTGAAQPGRARNRVVELFAGVGGFRLALERSGWRTVWANQWEPSTKVQHAADCYKAHWPTARSQRGHRHGRRPGAGARPARGGFPCQDYSVAKTASQARGLEGIKGVLWWSIYRHPRAPAAEACFLENVDRLSSRRRVIAGVTSPSSCLA